MKKNIILKRILIGILIFIAVLVVSGVCTYEFYIKPKYAEPIAESLTNGLSKEDLEVNKLFDELEDVLHDEEMQEYLNQENPNKAAELLNVVEKARAERSEKNDEEKNSGILSNEENSQSENNSSDNDSSSKRRLEKIKSQISPGDLKDGLALAGRADVGYILGLLNGGLTSEEKAELKQYLRARYSSSEISRGIQLFAKYSYLL